MRCFIAANEDSSAHESALKSLETRWQELRQLIVNYEKEIELSTFNGELQALTKARNEYQTWVDSTASNDELQVSLARKNSSSETVPSYCVTHPSIDQVYVNR